MTNLTRTCEECGFESAYDDEVMRVDCNGFPLEDNQDDCDKILCIECFDK